MFRLLEGEEPVDSIYRFARQHNLESSARRQLLQVVCSQRQDIGLPPCKRDLALVMPGVAIPHPIEPWFDLPGSLVVWENEEPADVVHAYWKGIVPDGERHPPSVNETFRGELIEKLCDGGSCGGARLRGSRAQRRRLRDRPRHEHRRRRGGRL